MITISPLSAENFETVIALRVKDTQTSFVASNVLSIAQSKTWDYLVPGVIYRHGTPVGFVLYGRDPGSQRVYIVRLMIDRSFQGNGYGLEAIRILLEKLYEKYSCSEIYVSVVPGNFTSERLFHSAGFLRTGEFDEDGEAVYRRPVDPSSPQTQVT